MQSNSRQLPVFNAGLNPYETPKGIGETRDIRENGIGVWRDGDLVVIHEQARLPRTCVKSGEKAQGAFPVLIKGRVIQIPLSGECFYWFVLIWRRLAAVAGICLLVAITAAVAVYSYLWEIVGVCAILGVAAIGLGWVALVAPTGILRCVKVEADYMWLRGACHSFLAQLPPWPNSRE